MQALLLESLTSLKEMGRMVDNGDYPMVRREALRQGWRIVPKKSGEMFLSPDGERKAMWHFTPSDRNALKKFIRILQGGGFPWPVGSRER